MDLAKTFIFDHIMDHVEQLWELLDFIDHHPLRLPQLDFIAEKTWLEGKPLFVGGYQQVVAEDGGRVQMSKNLSQQRGLAGSAGTKKEEALT